MGDEQRYGGLYDLPYPEAVEYPCKRMPMADRAAQFASFKALTGYEDAIGEAARLTDARLEPDDGTAGLLNAKMQLLHDHIRERPQIQVTYFVPDAKKAGGRYLTVSGRAKRIDDFARAVLLTDGRAIPMDDILAMDGSVFDALLQSGPEWG